MAFIDYWSELVGAIPRLPPLHAQQLVNRAWGHIRDLRQWSWSVVNDAQLFAPDAITAGTVSVTSGSLSVTAAGASKTAMDAVALANPPLAGAIGIGRQIRVGQGAPLYTITAYDTGTGVLTLERPYGEATNSVAVYSCYRAYYAPPNSPNTSFTAPDAGFIQWLTLRNPIAGYQISGPKLWWTQEKLNRIDPQRGSTGDAYIVAYHSRRANGLPVYELWPAPVKQRTYLASYVTRWPDLSNSQDLPQTPYDLPGLLIYKAKELAGEWALSNAAADPSLAQTNWVAYIQVQQKQFAGQRIQAIKQDDQINPLVAMGYPIPSRRIPLGGEFVQSHDLSGMM